MKNLQIRLANTADTEGIHFLLIRHFSYECDILEEEIYNRLTSNSDYLTLGAFLDETLIGVSQYYIYGENAFLGRVAIREDYQGQGIGTQLVGGGDSFLLNHRSINNICVSCKNQLIGFYQKLGYDDCDISYIDYNKGCGLPEEETLLVLRK